MRSNKFDFVKDLIVPVLIALVVVIANDFFLKNQKKRETKMFHEEAILLRQYEILNRILLFCVKHSHGHEVFKLRDSIANELKTKSSSQGIILELQKRKLESVQIKLDSLKKVSNKNKSKYLELNKIETQLKNLAKSGKELDQKIKFDSIMINKILFDPNKLTKREFDSLYYVFSDLPLFLTDKQENNQFNEDINFFKKNIGLIDHRIGLIVSTVILEIQHDFKYSGLLMSTSEARKSSWANLQEYKLWQKNLEMLYSVTYEYIYQEKFDGEIPRQKHIKIQDYLDKIGDYLIDSTLIGL